MRSGRAARDRRQVPSRSCPWSGQVRRVEAFVRSPVHGRSFLVEGWAADLGVEVDSPAEIAYRVRMRAAGRAPALEDALYGHLMGTREPLGLCVHRDELGGVVDRVDEGGTPWR